MFLTTRGRYAVSAIIDIVTNSNLTGKIDAPISLSQISQRQGISISYLEQIFLLLKKNNIVKSVKGPGGGYILAKNPNEITLSEILFASGEKVKMTKCHNENGCLGMKEKCVTHHIWQAFEEKIENYLTSITLEELTKLGNNSLAKQ